eukprot:m.93264 g.93264  ORF g.93264 m.93264 type:complete len:99 (-) comp9992_c0_seq1:179-475(-)
MLAANGTCDNRTAVHNGAVVVCRQVLSFNSPVEISAKSSSAKMSSADKVQELAEPMVATDEFKRMMASLKVVDFGLFGGEEQGATTAQSGGDDDADHR